MGKPCSFPGCAGISVAKGLCHAHYGQRRSGKELKPIRVRKRFVGPCVVLGCPNEATKGGMCTGHYEKWRRGTPLTPSKKRGESKVRVQLAIPVRLLQKLDDVVSEGHRTSFIIEAITRALEPILPVPHTKDPELEEYD